MGVSRQALQQLDAMVTVARLSQDSAIEHHLGIGAQHRMRWQATFLDEVLHKARLVGGNSTHVSLGRLAALLYFQDIRWHDLENNAELLQQFLSAWRSGGEINHGYL